jgi:TonB family protein
MNDRWLLSSFTASSVIHLGLIPVAALVMQVKPIKPTTVPVELIDIPRVEQPKKVEAPPPPPPRPKPQKITAPKLLSKPVLETSPLPPTGNTKEETKEKPVEEPQPLAALPENPGTAKAGWNVGSKAAEAEGSAAGAGDLFDRGDVGVVGGPGIAGGGGGKGTTGLGRGAKGDGTGGGSGSGEALSGLARPLGGYQVKPRYPESARRAGAQGVTLLRVRVLETGRVGEVLVEQSAGFRDLDLAAADAVKKWLFEPARRGKEPVSVWVMLPVKFELR